MELKTFIEEALLNIFDAVEDAQNQILHGELVPNREQKTGDADIEFELTVKTEEKEGQRPKLIVVSGSTNFKPPGAAPPSSGSPPPALAPPASTSPPAAPAAPQGGKLKFKIPVRLPNDKDCIIFRCINYCKRKRGRMKDERSADTSRTKPEKPARLAGTTDKEEVVKPETRGKDASES